MLYRKSTVDEIIERKEKQVKRDTEMTNYELFRRYLIIKEWFDILHRNPKGVLSAMLISHPVRVDLTKKKALESKIVKTEMYRKRLAIILNESISVRWDSFYPFSPIYSLKSKIEELEVAKKEYINDIEILSKMFEK
jgi:predicted AlkP superfamily pyrophosphatase or phosphodiesterase